MTTGKAFNPYWDKADRKKKDLFQQYINAKYNFTNPLDVVKKETLEIPKKRESENNKLKKQIHEYVERAVTRGILSNREEVIAFLSEVGFELNRKGKDYISVKNPETGQSLRLKGVYYAEGFRSVRAIGEELTGAGERDIGSTRETLARVEQELFIIVEAQARRNREKYTPERTRYDKKDNDLRSDRDSDRNDNRWDRNIRLRKKRKLPAWKRRRLEIFQRRARRLRVVPETFEKRGLDDKVGIEVIRAFGATRKRIRERIGGFTKLRAGAKRIAKANRDIERTVKNVGYEIEGVKRKIGTIGDAVGARIRRKKMKNMAKALDIDKKVKRQERKLSQGWGLGF